MNCKDQLSLLEEYVDGELDERESRRLEIHLSTCTTCRAEHAELMRERELYLGYTRDLDVTPQLWAGIRDRIGIREKPVEPRLLDAVRTWVISLFDTPRLSPALAAVLVVLAVSATALLMKSPSHTGSPNLGSNTARVIPNPNEMPDAPSVPHVEKRETIETARIEDKPVAAKKPVVKKPPTPEELIREAEDKYLAAITLLTRDARNRRSDLDPAVVARLDLTLEAIDQTIAQTREIVRKNPSDPRAVQYLLAAYAKKVDVLQEAAGFIPDKRAEETPAGPRG